MGCSREGFDIFNRVCWHSIRRHGWSNRRLVLLDSCRHVLGRFVCKKIGHHEVQTFPHMASNDDIWCAVCGKWLRYEKPTSA